MEGCQSPYLSLLVEWFDPPRRYKISNGLLSNACFTSRTDSLKVKREYSISLLDSHGSKAPVGRHYS